MIEYTTGQVVFSKSGRDQGKPFIVITVEGEYVYLVDGKLRRLEKPKKKKIKHVQMTYDVIEYVNKKLGEGSKLSNADIRKVLEPYVNPSSANAMNEEV
jgi:ribosomal protein L14E/L6E/L27E